jgi:hypothetical protein
VQRLIGLAFFVAIPAGIFIELAILPITWAICISLMMIGQLSFSLLWRFDRIGQVSLILGMMGAILLLSGWAAHLLREPDLKKVLLVAGAVFIALWIALQFVRPFLGRRSTVEGS